MTGPFTARLSKLEREKLARDCIRSIRGEGWTIRFDLRLDAWHVRQDSAHLVMGLTGLAFFSGRHHELECRKCGCTEDEACIGPRGPCWWVQYDLCSSCIEPLEKAA